MKTKLIYLLMMLYLMAICPCKATSQNVFKANLKYKDIAKVVNAVADWQIEHYAKMDENRIWKSDGDLSWENGVFNAALADWAEYTHNKRLINWYENLAKRNNYELGKHPGKDTTYDANFIAICRMYGTIYEIKRDDKVIKPTLERLEYIAKNPPVGDMDAFSKSAENRWSWCDALYMAPPAFAQFAKLSGNKKLLEYLHKEYWTTYNYLFDKKESLFFRDSSFFTKKERNGQKVFWGRGNAWVIGGLAQIIPYLDDKDTYKAQYIKLFKTMMHRLVQLQDKKTGYWHASLLDPESYPSPETSSTGFYTYALAWGINQGYLSKKEYLAPTKKAWKAMVEAVHPNGMLGWVQPIGADPQKVTKDMTEVYGAGAMMLAGMELIKLSRTR
jgi:unsaturated rhamnogalacturonyl hydrolase